MTYRDRAPNDNCFHAGDANVVRISGTNGGRWPLLRLCRALIAPPSGSRGRGKKFRCVVKKNLLRPTPPWGRFLIVKPLELPRDRCERRGVFFSPQGQLS